MTDDVLEALLESPTDDDEREGFRTIREMKTQLKQQGRILGRDVLTTRLRDLMDDGRLEVRRVRVMRIDGQFTVVPGYRIKRDA